MASFLLVLRWILQGSGEDCGVVSDCEELSGGYSQEMMGLVLGHNLPTVQIYISSTSNVTRN